MEAMEEQLRAVALGDREAFRALYAAAAPRLFAISLKILRRRDVAEDVLQEAFVRIWRHAGSFDPARGRAMAWMVTVTRRCALEQCARLRATGAAVPIDPAMSEVVEALQVSGTFEAEHHDLRRCLAELAERQRRIIVHAFVYGMTHSELAAALAVPLGTIKSWTRRALMQLKNCLER